MLVLVVYIKIKKNVREISKNQCGCCVVLRNEISMGVRYAGARWVRCVFLLVHWIFSLVYDRGVRRALQGPLGVSACACALNIKIKNKTPTI